MTEPLLRERDPNGLGGPNRDVYRLRDLDRNGKLAAAAVFVLLAAPFAAAVVRASLDGWTPLGDQAFLSLRVHDVLEGEWPLVGQPSTAGMYSDAGEVPARHPGPIQYYAFAPVVAAVGFDLGMIVGPALVNFCAVAFSAWVVFRRAGPAVGLVASATLGLIAFAQGSVVLTDSLSSNAGGIPLLALVVSGWAVLGGDFRLLPAAASAFSWVAQQHLAIAGVATSMAVLVAGTVIWSVVGAVRRGDRDTLASLLRWTGLAVAVSAVLWAPVVVDQFWGEHNVGNFIRYAQDSDRETVGWMSAFHQVLRAFELPPALLTTGRTGGSFWTAPSGFEFASACFVAAAFAAVGVHSWPTGRRDRSALVLTTFVLLAFALYSGRNVPHSHEANRINFYRWVFVANALVLVTFGWFVLDFVRRRWSGAVEATKPARAFRAVGMTGVVLASVLALTASRPRQDPNWYLFAPSESMTGSVANAVKGREKVLVVNRGTFAGVLVGPAVVLDLAAADHDVRVQAFEEPGYGSHMVDDGEADVVVLIESWEYDEPPPAGQLIDRYSITDSMRPEVRAARSRIADVLRDEDLRIDPDFLHGPPGVAPEDSRVFAEAVLEGIEKDPDEAVNSRAVLEFLMAGMLEQPAVDRNDLRTAIDTPIKPLWNQTHLWVRVLTPEEWRNQVR